MKRLFKILPVLAMAIGVLEAQPTPNELSAVTVFVGDFGAQAKLFFTKPVIVHHEVGEKGAALKLVFPQTTLGEVEAQSMKEQLATTGLVRDISLKAQNNELTMTFAFEPDKALIKVVKVKNSKRLTVHIYSKEELRRVKQASDGPLFLAHNFTHQLSSIPKSLKKKHLSLRIV